MKKNNKSTVPIYYVYYDKKTGEILSVSNEKNSNYKHYLEETYNNVEKLLSGEWKFVDYLIGYRRLEDDETKLSIIPKVDDEYVFRNGVYEWISLNDSDAEVVVEWDKPNKAWNFYFDKQVKSQYDVELLPSQLIFFVTLETDFDFLVRSIGINVSDLINSDKVKIPFTSSFEHDIKKVSIGSRLIFKSYKLKVINE